MKLVIHAHQVELPRDAPAFVRKHVVGPLSRLHDSPAAELTVNFGDVRMKKGGVDRACGLTLRLPRARTLRVESIKDDLRTALLDAADRLKRLVQREIAKQRSPSRKPMQRPLGRTYRRIAEERGTTLDGAPSTL